MSNPRKNFRFALEFDGLNMFYIEDVQPPKVELAEVEHGAPGNLPNGKTPGKMKVGDMVVKKIKPADKADSWAWDWLGRAIAGLKTNFGKPGFLVELAPDGVTPIQKYFIGDAWVKAIENSNYVTKTSGDNSIETVTFSVRYYFPIDSPEFAALFSGSAAQAAGYAGTLGAP